MPGSINWTPEDFEAHMAKFGAMRNRAPNVPVAIPEKPVKFSRSQPKRGTMNKIEGLYAALLEAQKIAGKIDSYYFESLTLTIAPGCRYTPDFAVNWAGGGLDFVEVKSGRKRKPGKPASKAQYVGAHMEHDARVKLFSAARMYPEFSFYLAWYYKGQWTEERIAA